MTIPFSLNVGSGLILLVLMDLGYSNRCTVVYHHCFNLYFTDNICCGTSSHMFICYLYIFFGEVSVRAFDPFYLNFFLVLSFKCSL